MNGKEMNKCHIYVGGFKRGSDKIACATARLATKSSTWDYTGGLVSLRRKLGQEREKKRENHEKRVTKSST